MTTHTPAKILRDYLTKQLTTFTSPGDVDDWPLYVSFMPDHDALPDNLGVVYDTVGVKDGRHMDGTLVEHQGVQVSIRAANYPLGWAKANECAKALEAVTASVTVPIEGKTYTLHNVSQQSPIFSAGQDANDTRRRWLFTINYLLTVSEA